MHWLAFVDLSMLGTCLLCIGSVPMSWSRIFVQSVKVYPIIDLETQYDEETTLYTGLQEEGCSCGF
ncbi:MAG: hypothetical protein L3J58_01590, partial [Emcibacter sp.]|nr:hypothetical protein [Emcibacter sp.]